jgi:hypothetical protein
MSESGIAKFERLATDAIGRDDTREQSRRKQIEMMGEKLTIKRSDIVRELEAIVHTRLFGPGPWLIDREAGAALEKRILEMGLRDEEKRRALGVELNTHLYEVFAGMWDEGEIPNILCDYGLIDKALWDGLYDRLEMGADPEIILRDVVRRAYFDYHEATKYVH